METHNLHKYGKRRTMLNVRVKMAERGYRSVAMLQRDLLKMGCEISNPQLIRILDNKTKNLNLDVLDALINLFDCSPAELLIEVGSR